MKPTNRVVNHMPITEARIHLGAVVKLVHLKGEYFILEKDGIPVAGLLPVDELEDFLELRNVKVKKQLDRSKQDLSAGRVSSARLLLADLKKAETVKAKKGSAKLPKIA